MSYLVTFKVGFVVFGTYATTSLLVLCGFLGELKALVCLEIPYREYLHNILTAFWLCVGLHNSLVRQKKGVDYAEAAHRHKFLPSWVFS